MNTPDNENFFSRWSRRKVQLRRGDPLPETASASPATVVTEGTPVAAPVAADAAVDPAVQTPLTPTLEDTQSLTPASDFSRFVARGVSPEVRNAAVRKLFTDPHFNVMDGLDIYIDDYAKPSPLSATDMAQMVSAQFLKLVDDPEDKDRSAPLAAAPERVITDVSAEPLQAAEDSRAPDASEPEEPPHDDHADLQLQPDPAPGRQGPGSGAG